MANTGRSHQSHQQHAPPPPSAQQHPQPEPGYVMDIAQEQVANGSVPPTQQQQFPQSPHQQQFNQQYQQPPQVVAAVVQPQQVVRQLKPITPGALDPNSLPFYAEIARSQGQVELEKAMRWQYADASLTGSFKRAMSHRITVQDVLVVSGVVVAVVFLYEGIAFKMDWPRMGLFDPANPMRAAPARRAA